MTATQPPSHEEMQDWIESVRQYYRRESEAGNLTPLERVMFERTLKMLESEAQIERVHNNYANMSLVSDTTKDERIAALEKDAARPTIEKMHAQWFKFGPTNEPVTVTFGTDDIERMKAAPEGTVWRLCNNDALNPHANGMSGTATGRDG